MNIGVDLVLPESMACHLAGIGVANVFFFLEKVEYMVIVNQRIPFIVSSDNRPPHILWDNWQFPCKTLSILIFF